MSLSIDDATLDAETQRQIAAVFPRFAPLLKGEFTALDYGCGAGRFTHALAQATDAFTTGYDPCAEFSEHWKTTETIKFTSDRSTLLDGSYELVLAWVVFCVPDVNQEAAAADIAKLLAPDGLLVLVDHMTPDGQDRWARFLPATHYLDLFIRNGVSLQVLGHDKQMDNHITILGGRKVT
jgi:SAM-dependent methyltransferase